MNPAIEIVEITGTAGVWSCPNYICGWKGITPLWMEKEFYLNIPNLEGWIQTKQLRTVASCPRCFHPAQYIVTSGGEDGTSNSKPDTRAADPTLRGIHSGNDVSGIHWEESPRHGLGGEDIVLPRDGLDCNYDWDGDSVPDNLVRFLHY